MVGLGLGRRGEVMKGRREEGVKRGRLEGRMERGGEEGEEGKEGGRRRN